MKTLFLCSNSSIEASMRFRVLQFVEPLREAGHEVRVSSFFDDRPGFWPARVLRGAGRRALDLVRSFEMDRLFVHRESFPLALNEYFRAMPSRVPMIFDFDDAIYLAAGRGWRNRIAQPASTRLLAERAAVVFAGNEVLAEYARQFTSSVRIVPTVVDTERYCPRERPARDRPLVGWVGSPSASRYLEEVLPAIDAVGKVVPFKLRIVGAGRDFKLSHVEVENVPWRLAEEVTAFQDLDIGLYPLADDAWARGKCGFKAIQYMACGVPFVVSPIGVIKDIVRDGTDGLWAKSEADWTDRLLRLLREDEMRKRLVSNARERVVARYSVKALAPSWINALERPFGTPGS